jgi:hypothetical protein
LCVVAVSDAKRIGWQAFAAGTERSTVDGVGM